MDRTDQVGRHDVLHLPVTELLRGAEQAIAGIADDHVNPSVQGERAINHGANRRRVGHFEHFDVERLRKSRDQIGDFARVADGTDNAVAARERCMVRR